MVEQIDLVEINFPVNTRLFAELLKTTAEFYEGEYKDIRCKPENDGHSMLIFAIVKTKKNKEDGTKMDG